MYVYVTSRVAYTFLNSASQYTYKAKRHRKNIMWNSRNALAKGPSFLNHRTVLELWYEKWSRFEFPHDHLLGS